MKLRWRVLLAVFGVLVLLVGAAIVSAEPLVRWGTRRVLAGMEGMRGDFDSVGLRLSDLSYEIHGLRIEKVDDEGEAHPFIRVDRARAGLYGRELLRGHVVGDVELERPRITLVESREPDARRTPKQAGGLAKRLDAMTPIRMDRVEVKDGEVIWVDAREGEDPVLRLHAIEATLENFATNAALARKEPTVFAMTGTLQRSGAVQAFATADPLAKALTFAGQATLREFPLAEVGRLMDAKAEVKPTEGTIDLFARFTAKAGALTGGVRPFVRGAELKAAEPGVGPKLKEWIGDAALEIFEDEETGAVATTIPIEGTVQGPQIQAVPTI
ncbi:MAG TPA: DUF748 domain-containing protein, partial [Anaeromyxobacter sp.]|nr:DUF748 domain-containing protein [Anaeromyxobacter sp.]